MTDLERLLAEARSLQDDLLEARKATTDWLQAIEKLEAVN